MEDIPRQSFQWDSFRLVPLKVSKNQEISVKVQYSGLLSTIKKKLTAKYSNFQKCLLCLLFTSQNFHQIKVVPDNLQYFLFNFFTMEGEKVLLPVITITPSYHHTIIPSHHHTFILSTLFSE